jgi:hypothetical protein
MSTKEPNVLINAHKDLIIMISTNAKHVQLVVPLVLLQHKLANPALHQPFSKLINAFQDAKMDSSSRLLTKQNSALLVMQTVRHV